MSDTDWWCRPRNVSIVVDNESWILPFAQDLVSWSQGRGDRAVLCRDYAEVLSGGVAFFLGCLKIAAPEILARNHRNLVVHASDLPKGRGFSPWTYAVLEGRDKIAVCLIEAADSVDSGDIVYKDWCQLAGTELVDDLRGIVGGATVALVQRYLAAEFIPRAEKQQGEPSFYTRRGPNDSCLDPEKSIAAQFDLLRVVDNRNYPAFFEYKGKRYKLLIEHDERNDK